jgi:hypothetical protein
LNQRKRPKSRWKSIAISGFLTPGGRLCVPKEIQDSELLKNPMWSLHPDGTPPVRDAMKYLKYAKDNY